MDIKAATPEEKGKFFYGVGRGTKPGVYTDSATAKAQVVSFSGFRLRKFKTEARAQQYVADVQAEPQTTWFVLKNSGRDGAYSCKQTAQSFKSRGSTLVERNSLSAAKRYLGTTRVRVYRDESDSGAEQQSPAKHGHGTASAAEPHGAAVAGTSQFFAVKGGSEDGVYRTLREALGAVIKGGGEYEMFGSEAEAIAHANARFWHTVAIDHVERIRGSPS